MGRSHHRAGLNSSPRRSGGGEEFCSIAQPPAEAGAIAWAIGYLATLGSEWDEARSFWGVGGHVVLTPRQSEAATFKADLIAPR